MGNRGRPVQRFYPKGCGQFLHALAGLLCLACFITIGPSPAWADTMWQETPSNGFWGNASNWTNGVPGSSTLVHFTTSSVTTTYIAAGGVDRNQTVLGVTFSGESDFTTKTKIEAGSFGGTFYIYTGGITANGGTQTFDVPVRVSSTTTSITNHGSGLLDFNSEFMAEGGAVRTVTFSGSGAIEIQRLSRRRTTADMNIVKEGTGTLTILDSYSRSADADNAGHITGSTTIKGGTIAIGAELNLGENPSVFNPNHLTLNGGTLRATKTFTIDDANRGLMLGSSGGALEVDSAYTLTVVNAITGPGSLTKTGTGTLALQGTNQYTGDTRIAQGKLALTGSAALASSLITVDNGATLDVSGLTTGFTLTSSQTLQGTGTVAGALTVAGTLAPGNSPGVLHTNNLTFLTDAVFEVQLDGLTAGTGYDQLDVTGTVDLGDGVADLSLLLGFVPDMYDQFVILANDGGDQILGFFKGLPEGSTLWVPMDDGTIPFRISYVGGTGNDIVLTAIPEPTGLLLAAAGLLGLAALRRGAQ